MIFSRPKGIFGKPFAPTSYEHYQLRFFHKWLESDKVRQFPPEFDDDKNLADYEVYIELKKRVNVEPDAPLKDVSGVHIARLIHDFLKELPDYFLEEARNRVCHIVSDACE